MNQHNVVDVVRPHHKHHKDNPQLWEISEINFYLLYKFQNHCNTIKSYSLECGYRDKGQQQVYLIGVAIAVDIYYVSRENKMCMSISHTFRQRNFVVIRTQMGTHIY